MQQEIILNQDIMIGGDTIFAGEKVTMDPKDVEKGVADLAKYRLRGDIARTSGDIESQHGSTNDAALIALTLASKLAVAISKAQTLEELKSSVAQMTADAERIANSLDAVKQPWKLKGLGKAVDQISTRAAAAAEKLQKS
jgi:hypothetical protein